MQGPCYKARSSFRAAAVRPTLPLRLSVCRWLTLALLACSLHAGAGVIVNAGVKERSIDRATLRNIYVLRQTLWSDRRPIVIFVLTDDHPVHVAFAKQKLGLYPYRLRQVWDRLSFSGMARAPIVVRDDELRARVRATPGAIGYTSKDISHDGIKTLTLD